MHAFGARRCRCVLSTNRIIKFRLSNSLAGTPKTLLCASVETPRGVLGLFLSVYFFSIDPQNFVDGSTNSPGYSVIGENLGLFKFWGNFRIFLALFSPTSTHRHFRIQLLVAYIAYIAIPVPSRLSNLSTPSDNNHQLFKNVVLWYWIKSQNSVYSAAISFPNPERYYARCRSTLVYAKNVLGKPLR